MIADVRQASDMHAAPVAVFLARQTARLCPLAIPVDVVTCLGYARPPVDVVESPRASRAFHHRAGFLALRPLDMRNVPGDSLAAMDAVKVPFAQVRLIELGIDLALTLDARVRAKPVVLPAPASSPAQERRQLVAFVAGVLLDCVQLVSVGDVYLQRTDDAARISANRRDRRAVLPFLL